MASIAETEAGPVRPGTTFVQKAAGLLVLAAGALAALVAIALPTGLLAPMHARWQPRCIRDFPSFAMSAP